MNSMGWIDREHIPAIERDGRYGRLINLTLRLLEARVPACGNCTGGWITIRDDDGHETSVRCENCQGAGTVPSPVDNEENGRADGRR